MTNTSDAAGSLAQVPIFAQLAPEVLEALAEQTEDRTFVRGDLIAERGASNEGLLVVVEGEMEVRRGERLLKVLGPGDYVGDISLIDGGPHSVDVTATTDGRGVFLSGGQFRVAIKHQPEAAMSVMEVLVARLRETLVWLDEADR